MLGLARAMFYDSVLKIHGLVFLSPICRRCDASHQNSLSKYFILTTISTNFKNLPFTITPRVWIKLQHELLNSLVRDPSLLTSASKWYLLNFLMSGLFFMWQTDYKLCVEFLNLLGLLGREDPPVLLRSRINLSKPRRSFLYQNLVRTFAKALLGVVLLVPTRFMSLAPLLTLLSLLTVTILSSTTLFVEDLSTILDLKSNKFPSSVWIIALMEPLLMYLICVLAFLLMVLGMPTFVVL